MYGLQLSRALKWLNSYTSNESKNVQKFWNLLIRWRKRGRFDVTNRFQIRINFNSRIRSMEQNNNNFNRDNRKTGSWNETCMIHQIWLDAENWDTKSAPSEWLKSERMICVYSMCRRHIGWSVQSNISIICLVALVLWPFFFCPMLNDSSLCHNGQLHITKRFWSTTSEETAWTSIKRTKLS